MIERLGEPLLERLSSLRGRVRGSVWLGGVARVIVCGLGLVLLAVLADVLYHLDDPGVRFLLLLGILLAVGAVAWRWLWRPLHAGLGDLELALRIERQHPGLRDTLSSGVQFAEGRGDPAVGSPALQRVAVAQAARKIESLDLEEFVPANAGGVWALGAAALLALSAILVLVSPQGASLGLQRLLMPFFAADWPRQVSLQLLSADLEPLAADVTVPLQVPRGEQFRFHVVNTRGELPTRVVLETRPAGQRRPVSSESLRPVNVANPQGGFREVAVGQLPAPRETLEFRVVGGDDNTMPWRSLKTVNPPSAEDLQVVITPPAYSRRPVERLPAGVGHVSGLVGSRVEVGARANRPIVGAQLRLRDRDRQPLQLGADGRSIAGDFRVTEAGVGSWWFELRDADGIQSSDLLRYELRGVADLVPETEIGRPASDQRVTPRAIVPMEIASRDDLGLATVSLVYTVDEGPETRVSLFELDTRPTELASRWEFALEPLGLKPGQVVRVHTEATDDFVDAETQARHVGRSIVRTLTIVDDVEKSRELDQQQAELLHDLEQTLRQQQQAREQTRALELQLEKAGALRPEDVDGLKRTELLQREISSQVKSPAAGLDRQARATLEELRNNRLADPTTERRLEALSEELQRLGETPLPEIENALGQARKLTEQPGTDSSRRETGRELTRAREQQSDVAEALGDLQRQLAEWRDDRSLGQDLQSLQANQQKINEQTEQLQQRIEQPGGEQNPGQTAADLARLAEQQAEQARQFNQLQQKLQERVDRARSRDPSARRGGTEAGRAGESNPDDSRSGPEGSQSEAGDPSSSDPSDSPSATEPKDPGPSRSQPAPGKSPTAQPGQQPPSETGRSESPESAESAEGDPSGDMPEGAPEKSPEEARPDSNPSPSTGKSSPPGSRTPAGSREEKSPPGDESRAPSRADEALADTLEEANRSDIAGKMQDAASNIQEKRLRTAAELQKQLKQSLQSLQDTLEQRREQDEAVLVKKIEESAREVADLEQRQADLEQQVAEAQAQPEGPQRAEQLERLRQQQQQLREEVSKLARLMQRAGADRAAEALQQAGNRMGDAEEDLSQVDPEQAQQEMQEALDNLEEAEQELEEELDEARERLADELLEKIAGEIRGLLDQQKTAAAETRRLLALHAQTGKWSRGQLVSIRQLAEAERGLQGEAGRLAERLQPAKVFQLSLQGVTRTLGRVVGRLENRDVDETTAALQDSAVVRLQQLVDAIEARQPEGNAGGQPGQPQQPEGEGGEPAAGGPSSESISAIAQLKILLELQRELEARTTELDALRSQPGREWTGEDAAELERLQEEQEQLADLTAEMAETLAQAMSSEEESEEDGSGMETDGEAGDEVEDEPGFLPQPRGEKSREPGQAEEQKVEDLPDVD